MNNIYADDILQAESRRNVSCAVRFSEPAASAAAQRQLCKLIKHFVPLHPDEGILPIMVRKLSGEDHEWIKDKLGNFSSYNLDPELARRKMSKMFNMACSALEAYRSLNDDRRVHRVSAQIPDVTAPLLRLHVILEKMPKEFGWSPGKPVAVWVLGAELVCNVRVEKVFVDCKEQQMRVTLAARRCSHNQLVRFVELASAGQTGPERTVMVCVKLGKLPTVANPLYETVVRMRLFDHLESWTLGYSILNLVYGRKVAPSKALALSINKDDKQTFTYVADDRWITLTKNQQDAVSLGCAGYPIVAIKAVFGSGKTLVAAIMASLLKKQKVIVTASENEVVAQLADTFCSVKELKDVTVLRYVPLGTTWKERHSTPVDLDEVLKNLGDEFGADIHSPADRKICRMFKERLSASFNAQKREEFELVETNVSSLLRGILRIMFNVRFPDIICISTSSLLNVFNDGGIFADQKSAFSVLICDEAAQIPEPMFVAITDRLPHVRQVYIGDPLQFGPHARCSSSLIPAKLGAGSILNALLKVPLIPVSVMETSFTAHPKLNDLPRSLIYNGRLFDGTYRTDRRLVHDFLSFPNPDVPFLFVNVIRSSSTLANSESTFNKEEAKVCKEIVKRLIDKGLQPSDIVIVNFYKEQCRRLVKFGQKYGVRVTTVEAFQNLHNEIVILLTTKAELFVGSSSYVFRNSRVRNELLAYERTTVEFLEDENRLAVALTRARQGLIILGCKSFLEEGEYWKKIIAWAEMLNCIVSSSELYKFLGVCHPVALRLNVLFLLDGSGSVSGSTFDMQMKMLNKIANMMHIGKNESLDYLLNTLRKVRHMSGTTKTGKAMSKALELFQKAKRPDEDVSQVAVVVTDGHSHDNPLPAAEVLRAAGVTILTLGIGRHINRGEIVLISGKEELAFQDLHKNTSLENFVSGFKNLSQGEHCEYARGSDGAQITCGPDFVQVEVSTTRKLKPSSGGFLVTSRAVLQFDPHFTTVHDHSFEIRCFYADNRKKEKNPRRAQGVNTLEEDAAGNSFNVFDGSNKMTCSYQVVPEIDQCSPNGVTVGTQLLHRWICDQTHERFLVHSCSIIDPVTHRSQIILDNNGCTVDKSIISDLAYSQNGTVTALGRAVRFTDAPIVRYSCSLKLCSEENEDCNSSFESAAYDDDVETLLPDPEPAIMKTIGEKHSEVVTPSSSTLAVSSTFSAISSERMSSIAQLFPPGGVDVKLNPKSVAIVETDHARDQFKQALQLRASSAQPSPIERTERISKSNDVHADIHEMPKHTRSVLVKSSVRRKPNNVVLRKLKGFVRKSSRDKNVHENVKEAILSETSPAVHHTVRSSTLQFDEVTDSIETMQTTQMSRYVGENYLEFISKKNLLGIPIKLDFGDKPTWCFMDIVEMDFFVFCIQEVSLRR
ncbi:von Willebrand factor type A domain protein [Necator americanus]|uniref:von Willebrand factor type A domain protein n=1 Tax=Necator americanus TaxID=51031 RepID=W2TFI9_NECAM|nr:von Willebrand factor type A domain protein [Necator americanus]ETN80800.1 von Willebrand factor type A domain protein [Necator americanus]